MSDTLSVSHAWPDDAENAGPRAFTSTRAGGVSEGGHASLNIGRHVGDDEQRVTENRARLLAANGLAADRLALCSQTHSTRVVAVQTGHGALDPLSQAPSADGLATSASGLAVGVMTADCLPVLLWAKDHGAVAAVHAGRVGLYDGIIASAMEAMSREVGAAPSDCRVVIGPSIGPCCYEVSVELADAFRARFGADIASGRQLDLWSAAERALHETGVPAASIHVARACTCCDAKRFFSHRRDGAGSGRMVSVVVAP